MPLGNPPSTSGRGSPVDAHLWASDARLFANTLAEGPDLYASDAALYSAGDASGFGPDLWASDAVLFATAEDRARVELDALKVWLESRAISGMQGRDGDGNEQETCAVCLGDLAMGDKKASSETKKLIVLRCRHAYHLKCLLDAFEHGFKAGHEKPTCPTCRGKVRRGDDE